MVTPVTGIEKLPSAVSSALDARPAEDPHAGAAGGRAVAATHGADELGLLPAPASTWNESWAVALELHGAVLDSGRCHVSTAVA